MSPQTVTFSDADVATGDATPALPGGNPRRGRSNVIHFTASDIETAPAALTAHATPPAAAHAADDLTTNTINPHTGTGYGTYQMRSPSGHTVAIPYPNIPRARQQGYNFADQAALHHYAQDFTADPAHHDAVATWVNHASVFNPLANVVRIMSGVGQGMGETAAGADVLARKLTGTQPTKAEESFQLGVAEDPVHGFFHALGNLGEQAGELYAGEGLLEGLTEGAKLPAAISDSEKVQRMAEILQRYPVLRGMVKVATEGLKAGTEQAAQVAVKTGGNVPATKQAAELGGLAGGITTVIPDIGSQLGEFSRNVLRHRFDIDNFGAGKIIQKTTDENAKIDEEAAQVHKDNLNLIRKAKAARNDAEVTRLEHDNVVNRQQAVEAKRTNLTDALRRTRQTVADRITNINNAAKAYFQHQFSDIAEKLDAPDPETGQPRTVPYEDLDADIEQAEEKIKGKRENVAIFNDIAKKAQGAEEPDLTPEEISNLSPDELHALHVPGAKYSDLDGYYQEAGRAVGNSSTPPDVRQALVEFRKLLAKRMDGLAEEVDPALAAKHRLLRQQYREYAEGFKDYTGPSGSGSPVAKGLQAADYENATDPYLNQKQAVEERTKDIVTGNRSNPATQFTPPTIADSYVRNADGVWEGTGKGEPAWRYRRQTHALIERMRDLQAGLDALPSSAELERKTAASAANVAASRATAREAAVPQVTEPATGRTHLKLEPGPARRPLTVEALRKAKEQVLVQQAHNLGKFGVWVAVGGLTGGIYEFMRTGDLAKAAAGAGMGVASGFVAPYVISKMLAAPSVVQSLTRVTPDDLRHLAAMSPEDRVQAESLIQRLAEEAVRTRRLEAAQIPWLRILGGEAGRRAGAATSVQQPPAPAATNQNLNRQLGLPAAGSPATIQQLNQQLGITAPGGQQ